MAWSGRTPPRWGRTRSSTAPSKASASSTSAGERRTTSSASVATIWSTALCGTNVRISRSLNLVVPVDTEAGTIYVHSTPISRDVFERYYLVLSKTFAQIYQEGLAAIAGPRVGFLLLRDVAQNTRGTNGAPNAWEGTDGVANGLINEIRRLTNVIMPGPAGWE